MSVLDGTLFLLEAHGIHPAGIPGIFDSQEKAKAAAVELWPQTDGYHSLVIRPIRLNELDIDTFPRAGIRTRTTKPICLIVETA